MPMPFDLDLIKQANPIVDIVGRAVQLRKTGREYVALCPFHGEKTPSFTVMPERGRFHCFGCEADGDVIDFTRRMHNVDLKRACEMLGGADQGSAPIRMMQPPAPPSAPEWAPVMPVPDDVPPPPAAHPKLGTPDHIARVLSRQGELLHLIYRFEPRQDGERKQIRPLCFDGAKWVWKAPPDPRPLYGLPLADNRPVLLVEGEKKRDAAQQLLGDLFDVVSWPNGAQGVQHASWRALAGKDVVLWRDADDGGQKAEGAVVEALAGLASSVRLVTPPEGVQPGWDVGDAVTEGWNQDRLLRLIDAAQDAPEPDPQHPEDPGPGPDEDAPYQPRQRRAGSAAIEWGEPVDFLSDDSLGVPQLLPEHVPAAIWPICQDVSRRMGVDPAAVAVTSITCAASVISEDWEVQPKRNDNTWKEHARLWAGVVGDPSILKSPMLSACTKPIQKMEIAAAEAYGDEYRAHKETLAQHKADVKAKKEGLGPEPRAPKKERFMVEGTTIEALSEVLRSDDGATMTAPQGKVLVRHDEMAEFFAGLDRYSAGKASGDRGAYLRLYNGGHYSVDRIGRGSFHIKHWSACFAGGIQPGPIQEIAGKTADDGLLQRFMWIVPGRQLPGLDVAPDRPALDRYDAIFPALAAMNPQPDVGSDYVRPITLHTNGHAHRDEIDALVRGMTALPTSGARLKSALGKWSGLFGRLVLTFHLVEIADARVRREPPPITGVIPPETTERVLRFMSEILLPHLLRAHAVMFATTQTGHAQSIAGWILRTGLKRVTVREITRQFAPLRPPEKHAELRAVMANLVTVGWLDPEEPTNLAKGVISWLVNPAVHDRFAERAERERTAVATAKDQVAADMAVLERRRPQRSAN